MIKATYSDKQFVVDILTQAFDKNKSVNYVAKQDNKRNFRIKKLMEYSFEVCWLFGDIYLSNDKNAAALILYPIKKKTTFKSILLDLSLAINTIGLARVSDILNREAQIKKHHPSDFIYLWYLGVLPEFQGKGIGSSLLNDIDSLSKKQNLPIFLETSTIENLPLYKRFDYEIYNELYLNYKLFLLKKIPS